MNKNPEQPRIAIVGAGPAGMSAAWFLKQNGYTNVRIFEKIERVGGKCLTFDIDGRGAKSSLPYTDCWTRSR